MKKVLLLFQNSIRNPFYNLSLEESISLNLVEEGLVGAIRLWKNQNSTVLGISDQIEKNIPEEKRNLFKENFSKIIKNKKNISGIEYISRRASGGGTVFHSLESNLNYSIFVSLKEKPELYPVRESYQTILGFIIKSLEKQKIFSVSAGKSDLAILKNDVLKKISGNAQFRKKDCLVQHGTIILNDSLLNKISQNLSHPPEEPEYRKNRTHKDFLTSVPEDFSIEKFGLDIQNEIKDFFGNEIQFLNNADILFWKKILQDTNRLYNEKYANLKFIFSR